MHPVALRMRVGAIVDTFRAPALLCDGHDLVTESAWYDGLRDDLALADRLLKQPLQTFRGVGLSRPEHVCHLLLVGDQPHQSDPEIDVQEIAGHDDGVVVVVELTVETLALKPEAGR